MSGTVDISCSVCFDSFLEGDEDPEVYVVPCGHVFHGHCLVQWFQRSLTCPQCRSPLLPSSVFRVFWERIRIAGRDASSTARMNSRLIRENKLLKFELKLAHESMENLRDTMQQTRSSCLQAIEKQESKSAVWRDVCATHWKRLCTARSKVQGLKTEMKKYQERATLAEEREDELEDALCNMNAIVLDLRNKLNEANSRKRGRSTEANDPAHAKVKRARKTKRSSRSTVKGRGNYWVATDLEGNPIEGKVVQTG